MTIDEIKNGPHGRIVFLVENDGRCPAREYFDNLARNRQGTLIHLFNMFCDTKQMLNIERFRKETDNTYCLKVHQVRISCFFRPNVHPRTLVLTFGFTKKDQKMPKREKKRTEEFYQRFTGEAK
jgi:hypothetical protein